MGSKSSTEESAQNRRSRVDDRVTRQDWVALLSSRVRLARSILITDQSLVTDRSMSVADICRKHWRKTASFKSASRKSPLISFTPFYSLQAEQLIARGWLFALANNGVVRAG